MSYIKQICLYLFLLISTSSFSQSISGIEKSFTESTSPAQKFQMHLDTINRYIYVDHQIVQQSIDECERLKKEGLQITDVQKVDFALAKVYHLGTKSKHLESYRLFEDYKHLLDLESIPNRLRNSFIYMEGYTLMELGDHEFAQNRFYEVMENGRNAKDTLAILQSLYSLGQLYGGKGEYEKATDYFLECFTLKKENNFKDESQPLLLLELMNIYVKQENYEEAERFANEMLALESFSKRKELQIDFYLLKSEIEIGRKKVTAAELAYNKADKLTTKIQNSDYRRKCDFQLGNLLNSQGKHKSALVLYEKLIAAEKPFPEYNLELYTKAHETCNKLGEYQKSYIYLLKSNDIEKEILNDKKKQQTAYLSAKFGAKEKERENQFLEAEILQQKTENKYLYALDLIFLLIMVLLFLAFYQKRNYNKQLKGEVKLRTKELETSNSMLSNSNKELDEFNRILSHDLREPLRSIVGFSTLLKNELRDNEKAREYLSFISKSGHQLSTLIEAVSQFRKAGKTVLKMPAEIEIEALVANLSEDVFKEHTQKKVTIEYVNLPKIYSYSSVLLLCFKKIIENGIIYNKSESPTIQIRYHKKEGQHLFQFQDNGIGIATVYHETIFGMFRRLNDRRYYEGAGLGLNIAAKTIEKIGGDIMILDSEEGSGTTFQLRFPVISEEVYPMVQQDNRKLEEVL